MSRPHARTVMRGCLSWETLGRVDLAPMSVTAGSATNPSCTRLTLRRSIADCIQRVPISAAKCEKVSPSRRRVRLQIEVCSPEAFFWGHFQIEENASSGRHTSLAYVVRSSSSPPRSHLETPHLRLEGYFCAKCNDMLPFTKCKFMLQQQSRLKVGFVVSDSSSIGALLRAQIAWRFQA